MYILLVVYRRKARNLLGYRPVIAMDEQLEKMVKAKY